MDQGELSHLNELIGAVEKEKVFAEMGLLLILGQVCQVLMGEGEVEGKKELLRDVAREVGEGGDGFVRVLRRVLGESVAVMEG
jgi:hypothetical protein